MAPKKKAKAENGAKVTDAGEDGGACVRDSQRARFGRARSGAACAESALGGTSEEAGRLWGMRRTEGGGAAQAPRREGTALLHGHEYVPAGAGEGCAGGAVRPRLVCSLVA